MLVPYEGDGLENEGERGVVQKPKRLKKWFEDASSGDGADGGGDGKKRQKRRRPSDTVDEPQTLEDLEAMAVGLLGH
jgi:ATP-dependent RNA helicase DDX10/DBP4